MIKQRHIKIVFATLTVLGFVMMTVGISKTEKETSDFFGEHSEYFGENNSENNNIYTKTDLKQVVTLNEHPILKLLIG